MKTATITEKLQAIIEAHEYETKSGSPLAIAEELLNRITEIDDLVIVGNPACIEPMVYTTDEVEDESIWSDGCPDDYTDAKTWIDENYEAA